MTRARPPVREIPLNEIEVSAALQTRYRLCRTTIEEYARDMRKGAIFPPLTVFSEDGSERKLLADGFHRIEAASLAGFESFGCIVREGGIREALEYALGGNDAHGLRRSNKDKRTAIAIALRDPVWIEWSNTDIGRLCRVSDKLVAHVRAELVDKGEIEKQEVVKTSQGGRTVQRKASTKKGSNIRTAKKKKKKQGVATARKAKTQDEIQLQEAKEGIDLIISIPHDGAEAFRRWGPNALKKATLAHDWLGEYLAAAKDDQP